MNEDPHLPTILLVDDDSDFLDTVADLIQLGGSNLRVVLAGDGESALNQVKSRRITLLSTDLAMPEMDGLELITLVRRDLPRLPIIVVTAMASPAVRSELDELSVLAIIEKPIDVDSFMKLVEKTVSSPAPKDDQERHGSNNCRFRFFAFPCTRLNRLADGRCGANRQWPRLFLKSPRVTPNGGSRR